MRFGEFPGPLAGVSVPLFSLRTARSVGIGQFPDIVELAKWCSAVGLRVIQLLPLNDTGGTSSPYSALSAFALNPIYIDVLAVEGSACVRDEVLAFRAAHEAETRLSYDAVRELKIRVLRRIFASVSGPGLEAALRSWMKDRPWAMAYAVFMALREEARGAPWWEWRSDRAWSPEAGPRLFDSLGSRALFHVFAQQAAERQLAAASAAAECLGVRIKGDIPILMSRDSVDVWARPEYFDLDFQAGAPPDMFSPDGQNWGFPPYRWETLERAGYSFWRERISHAGRFYHAVRIDHVLGFLRIWRIPASESSGVLGHFHPQRLMRREELAAYLDAGRLVWLSVPHVPGRDIDAALGAGAADAKVRLFRVLPGEDLYHIRPDLDSEKAIMALAEPENTRAFLLARHRDRALLPVGSGTFAACWYFGAASSYRSLTQRERELLDRSVRDCYAESERIWERDGRRLLAMLRESTDALLCAEDLGAVPDCLPRMLADLGILSLKIERWARDYAAEGQPLIPPASYPRLSVCSPSGHDTSTLRGWWEEEGWDREAYYRSIGGQGACPATLTVALSRTLLTRAMRSSSLLAIAQIQDYLALAEDLRAASPADERVNVPGTVSTTNWSYRIPLPLEEIAANAGLAASVREVVAARAHAGCPA